ncbi:single-stranded DNA-binding protein [Paracoccus sp. S3-43]|uniref:single-stranded DNA-binding protein n=1 Tax=Paracoccus sp. S3-43 TaxID=3030011 RepID=UPI0023AE810A|nr:single-stranded DNA-binding protein [Paracoccus sp. S3-43]WEF25843.1 single-stranded DNA-binding protein [Paracoccus sp. S3-43]
MSATITAMGRVARMGEVRAAGNTEVLNVRVAVDNGWGDRKKTDFFNLGIWGKQARTMEGLLQKGGLIFFTGEFSTREYEYQGEKRQDLEIRVDRLDLGPRGAATADDRRATEPGPTQNTGRQAGFNGAAVTDPYDRDEIPF